MFDSIYTKIILLISRSKLILILSIPLLLVFFSCGEKKEENLKPIISFSDSASVFNEAKNLFGDKLKTLLIGNFDEDTSHEAVAGIEIVEKNVWGIKFALLKIEGNTLVNKFETKILDGSFKEALVKKIKFTGFNHELVYYNSEDYFWGSGGGEVFSYIINFENQEVYYAHLFSETRRQIQLYLSDNIKNDGLRKFFISTFKKDYPELQLVSEDVTLEF